MPYADPEKRRAYQAAWRAANPERGRAADAAWQTANPGRKKAANAAWYAANSERSKAATAAWHVANPERRKAASAAWYAANTERHRTLNAVWRAANPERAAEIRVAISQRRRARKAAVENTLTSAEERQLRREATHCALCGMVLVLGGPRRLRPSLDHVVPIALGGGHTRSNVQMAHKGCNSAKGSRVASTTVTKPESSGACCVGTVIGGSAASEIIPKS